MPIDLSIKSLTLSCYPFTLALTYIYTGMILKLVSYVGIVSAFVSLTMAVASGLYYLSELVEENTRTTQRWLTKCIYAIIGLHVLLLVIDRFPFVTTALSIGAHVLYLQNLNKFPYIELSSPIFIASCFAALINHWLWYRHFSDPSLPPAAILEHRPDYSGPTHPPFSQVASFFGICVWLVPFALFVSLSASENVLPMSNEPIEGQGDRDAEYKRKRRVGLAKVAVEYLWIGISKVAAVFGYEIETQRGPILE